MMGPSQPTQSNLYSINNQLSGQLRRKEAHQEINVYLRVRSKKFHGRGLFYGAENRRRIQCGHISQEIYVRTMSAQHLTRDIPRETYILCETLCGHSADIVRTYISRDICPHYIFLGFHLGVTKVRKTGACRGVLFAALLHLTLAPKFAGGASFSELAPKADSLAPQNRWG